MKIFTCSTFILSIIGSDVSCSWQTQDCTSFLVLFYLEEGLSRMQLLLTRTAVFYRLRRCLGTFHQLFTSRNFSTFRADDSFRTFFSKKI